jgi:hypothetical protein
MKTTALVSTLFTAGLFAQSPASPPPPNLPVREVTVFKDGHAYVIRERPLPADGSGEVVLDELPQPVLGTFWPYATDGARIVSAKAGRDTVAREVAAVDLRQIARANRGKQVVVVTFADEVLDGKLLGVPSRQDAADAGDGELLVLQTVSGTRMVPLTQVRGLEVRGEFASTMRGEETRERLVLRTQGGGAEAKVGVMYVQHGLRWIPAYRVDIDGKGQAAVQFEATLVNDLVDLDAATVHLVIGVPKFEFEGLLDPISLQQEAAQVAAQAQFGRFANALSNSLMTQSAYSPQATDGAGPVVDPEGGGGNEDLFVFTLRDVTLKKGERMVLPIAAFPLQYRDVYRLDVPFAPPMEVRQSLQSERAAELARELAAPKARHVLRLQNGTDAPLTTAPALVLHQGRVLAQGRMRYAPKGATTDLEINVAIDVCVDIDENDVSRDQTVRFGKEEYGRVDVLGTIGLENKKSVPVEIEVTRRTLGIADHVEQDGSQRQLGLAQAWFDGNRPAWWGWWSWPHWWFQRNGFAEFRWTVTLAPGASTKLAAGWHYFWR